MEKSKCVEKNNSQSYIVASNLLENENENENFKKKIGIISSKNNRVKKTSKINNKLNNDSDNSISKNFHQLRLSSSYSLISPSYSVTTSKTNKDLKRLLSHRENSRLVQSNTPFIKKRRSRDVFEKRSSASRRASFSLSILNNSHSNDSNKRKNSNNDDSKFNQDTKSNSSPLNNHLNNSNFEKNNQSPISQTFSFPIANLDSKNNKNNNYLNYQNQSSSKTIPLNEGVQKTLLPENAAKLVSAVSKGAILSFKIGTFVTSSTIKTFKFSVLTSFDFSQRFLESVVVKASEDIFEPSVPQSISSTYTQYSLNLIQKFSTLTKFLTSASFNLFDSSVTSLSQYIQDSIHLIEAIFGSTDSSRAIAAIIQMARREIGSDKTIGVFKLVSAITYYSIIQNHCYKKTMYSIDSSLIWKVIVLDNGESFLEYPLAVIKQTESSLFNTNIPSFAPNTHASLINSLPNPFEKVSATYKNVNKSQNSFDSTTASSNNFSLEASPLFTVNQEMTTQYPTYYKETLQANQNPSLVDSMINSTNTHMDENHIVENCFLNQNKIKVRAKENSFSGQTTVELFGLSPNTKSIVLKCYPTIEPYSAVPTTAGRLIKSKTSADLLHYPITSYISISDPSKNKKNFFIQPRPSLPILINNINDYHKTEINKNDITTQDVKKQVMDFQNSSLQNQNNFCNFPDELHSTIISNLTTECAIPPINIMNSVSSPYRVCVPSSKSTPTFNYNKKNTKIEPISNWTTPIRNENSLEDEDDSLKYIQHSIQDFPLSIDESPSINENVADVNSNSYYKNLNNDNKIIKFKNSKNKKIANGTIYYPKKSDFYNYQVGLDAKNVNSFPTNEDSRNNDAAIFEELNTVKEIKPNESSSNQHSFQEKGTSENKASGLKQKSSTMESQLDHRMNLKYIAHFVRFASASYGQSVLRLLGISIVDRVFSSTKSHHSEHYAFSNHTGVSVENILMSSFSDPEVDREAGISLKHFIAVDHRTRSVVLTIRGTLGFEDVLTDLTCEYESFNWRGNTYYAHRGMLRAAQKLTAPTSRVRATISSALRRLGTSYGLVITGHSLGGGVGALLAILLSEPITSNHQNRNFLSKTSNSVEPSSPASSCKPVSRTMPSSPVAEVYKSVDFFNYFPNEKNLAFKTSKISKNHDSIHMERNTLKIDSLINKKQGSNRQTLNAKKEGNKQTMKEANCHDEDENDKKEAKNDKYENKIDFENEDENKNSEFTYRFKTTGVNNMIPGNRRINCYTYGCPAIICPELQCATASLITSVIFGLDIVPTLSLGLLRDYQSMANALYDEKMGHQGIIESIRDKIVNKLSRTNSNTNKTNNCNSKSASSSCEDLDDEDDPTNFEYKKKNKNEESFIPENEDVLNDCYGEDIHIWKALTELRSVMNHDKLVPPGNVYHLQTRTVHRIYDMRTTKAVQVTCRHIKDVEKRFREPVFGAGIFHHNPAYYERILNILDNSLPG